MRSRVRAMTRDMDHVRDILKEAEAATGAFRYSDIEADIDRAAFGHHVKIMGQAGLIEGEVYANEAGVVMDVVVADITWKGHEFLDAARNDELWERAKQATAERGLTPTFDVLKQLLEAYLAGQLGLED
jgi:hypothetical protein